MTIKRFRSSFGHRAGLASLMVCMPMLLLACGSSTNTSAPATAPMPPSIANKPDVIITIDGAQHACVAALYSEAQGSTIPCSDLVAFVRDELKVPSGAVYELRTIPVVDKADIIKVRAGLKEAGYRSTDEL